jgi:Cof subfamily protein (haloacid dehalogenase superfamily)
MLMEALSLMSDSAKAETGAAQLEGIAAQTQNELVRARALSALAAYYMSEGQNEKASGFWQQITSLPVNPYTAIAYISLGDIAKESGDIEAARKYFQSDYLVVIHGGLLLELIPKGFSKAEGIKRMLDKLGIRRENTYAFGDSMNDYEMLEYVQYGVAMGNSDERLLSVAAYVADTVENDGIYKALEHYGLI